MLQFLSYHLFSVGSLRDCFGILVYRNLFKRAVLLSTFNLLNEGYKCLLLQDFFSSLLPFTSVSEVPIHSFTEIFHRSPPISYIRGRRAVETSRGERRLGLLSFCLAGTFRSFLHTELTKVAIDTLRKLAFDDAALWWIGTGSQGSWINGGVGGRDGWFERIRVCVWQLLQVKYSVLCMVEKACDGALYELLWHFYHLWWSLKKTQMFSSNKPMNFSLWVVTQKCIMNEWMHEVFIEHFYCVLLYTQSMKGSLLNHHQCTASTWMMWCLSQDNGTSVLTTHHLSSGGKDGSALGKYC